MWATWRLESEVTVLNGEDRNRFPSMTQCFPGENSRQLETVVPCIFPTKKVKFLSEVNYLSEDRSVTPF